MAKERKKGGGFLRGVLYGLIVSSVIYLVLCVVFPLVETAPMADAGDPVQTAPQVFDVGEGTTDDSGISVGGINDSSPNVSVSTSLDSSPAVEQPVVATESAAVPNIGETGNQATEAAPVVTTAPAPIAVAPQPVDVTTNESAPAALPDADSGEAFDVFSVPFAHEPGKPMLAIVFEDTLEASLRPLFDSGMPLNFAVLGTNIDPSVSRSFREQGFEVLTLLTPDMAAEGDLSSNISKYINNVPASIGVIDSMENGVMLDTGATQIMIETAAVNGMGTIAFAGAGDINARNLSRFYSKPFGSIHRVIDESPEITAIKNALDRATLTAQTSGSAIVYARTRDTTIQALLEWMASSRAARVQIVPISQIMRPN